MLFVSGGGGGGGACILLDMSVSMKPANVRNQMRTCEQFSAGCNLYVSSASAWQQQRYLLDRRRSKLLAGSEDCQFVERKALHQVCAATGLFGSGSHSSLSFKAYVVVPRGLLEQVPEHQLVLVTKLYRT